MYRKTLTSVNRGENVTDAKDGKNVTGTKRGKTSTSGRTRIDLIYNHSMEKQDKSWVVTSLGFCIQLFEREDYNFTLKVGPQCQSAYSGLFSPKFWEVTNVEVADYVGNVKYSNISLHFQIKLPSSLGIVLTDKRGRLINIPRLV